MKSKLISRVFCHPKNSTDSICSCIGLSYLLNQLNIESKPICSPTPLNAQTQSILSQFKLQPPQVVSDLYARASDLKYEQPIYLKENESVARALEVYDIYKHKLMPVVNEDGVCLGIVTFSSLFKSFLNSRDDNKLRAVYSSTKSIKYTLKSKLNYNTTSELRDMQVYTVADDLLHLKAYTAEFTKEQFSKSIFISGANIEVNNYLLSQNIGCLILCRDSFELLKDQNLPEETKIKSEIVKIDENQYYSCKTEQDCIIFTDYSVTTTTILTKQSTPVSYYLNTNPALLVNENAKIEDIIKTLTRQYESGVCILDNQKKLIGVLSRSDILKKKLLSLTLVNFNDKQQALEGIFCDYLEVDRVVDNHPIKQCQTDNPPEYYIRDTGATCTLVCQLFRENVIIPPVGIAGALLGGILASTGNLLNSFTTVADQEAVKYLCQLTGIDQTRYGKEILQSSQQQISIVQLFQNDISTLQFDGYKIDCSSIEMSSAIEIDEQLVAKLESCIGAQMVANSSNVCCALILDYYVQTSNNLLIVDAEKEILKPLLDILPFQKKEGFDNVFLIGDWQSRRLQVFPMLKEYLQKIDMSVELK